MVQIIWDKDIESDNRKEIEKFLLPLMWLTPGWLQHLFIYLQGDDPNDGATVSTLLEYEYRYATIKFYSSWLIQPDVIKRDNVIHELVHILVNNQFFQARRIVKTMCDDERMQDFALKELSLTIESVTQDLTHVLGKMRHPE